MKNIFILLLIAAIAWFGWHYFFRKPEVIIETRTETRTVKAVAAERYGQELRSITDSVFSSLTGNTPNPISSIRRLTGMAHVDFQNGELTHAEADLIVRLCAFLEQSNSEREQFEAMYRSARSRQYASFRGPRDAAQKRRFFIESHLRRWDEFVAERRVVALNAIEQLRHFEREREYE